MFDFKLPNILKSFLNLECIHVTKHYFNKNPKTFFLKQHYSLSSKSIYNKFYIINLSLNLVLNLQILIWKLVIFHILLENSNFLHIWGRATADKKNKIFAFSCLVHAPSRFTTISMVYLFIYLFIYIQRVSQLLLMWYSLSRIIHPL